VQPDHDRPDERAGDRAEAVAGVEPGHDGPAEMTLDQRSLHVHRHVPSAGGEAEQEQPDHDRDQPA
jgi:hypothetical protein